MRTLLIFSIGLIISLNSCSFFNDIPTEEMALDKIKSSMDDNSKACIEITDFKKTDGVSQTIFGQKVYTLNYSVKITFTQDAYQYWLAKGGFSFDTEESFKKSLNTMTSASDYAKYKKGQTLEFTGKVEFEKTENGWK